MKNVKLIASMVFTSILFTCNSNKKKEIISEPETVVTENVLFSKPAQAENCSPRLLKRNAENGLILLSEKQLVEVREKAKSLDKNLPIIGLLMYDNVLTTEITAPLDVFTKHTEDGKKLFNVITIAETYDFVVSEEGLKMFPDYSFENTPQLDVLIVPSA